LGTRKVVLFVVGLFATSLVTAAPAAASTGSDTRTISAGDTTSIAAPDAGISLDVAQPEILDTSVGADDAAGPNGDTASDRSHTRGVGVEGNAAKDSARESSDTSQVVSFDGLNHFAERFGATSNALSVAPPDQGMCEGNGMVVETVNAVTAVYSSTGALLGGPTALNKFYGYPPAINRATGVRGPFVTDPSCYFDRATQRWFMDVLTLDTFASGRFKGSNHLDIAVSKTPDPTGSWVIYRIPIQDDGTQGTPDHHCSAGHPAVTPTNPNACLGDYPHIGADANGLYLTTNEYSFFGPEFKAAQIYAFSKQALAANAASIGVTQIDTTAMVGGVQSGFTVWPATATNGDFNASAGGTENFLSSNAASEVNALLNHTSRDLIVWSLTNTASLGSGSPDLTLTNAVLKVGRYSAPPKATQKVGNTPLADCLNDTTLPVGAGLFGCWRLAVTVEPKHNQVEQQRVDTNDTRMQQVTYAGGMVYGALDTGVKVKGQLLAGIQWFAVDVTGGEPNLANEGFLGSAGTNLSYPALAVNADGQGVMAFSLMGDSDYPTAAWAPFDAKRGMGDIRIAAAGQGPTDGFTDYGPAFGNPARSRWGDYGAALIDGSNVWIASEYIGQTCDFNTFIATNFRCGSTRTQAGNWDTRITELSLS